MTSLSTQVAIIGAGPAGLILGLLLRKKRIDCVVLERRTRADVLARVRAGVLEPDAVAFLKTNGIQTRIESLGRQRNCSRIAWQDRPGLMIDVKRWTGTEITAYGQSYLTEDLYAQADAIGLSIYDGIEGLSVTGIETDRPSLEFRQQQNSFHLRSNFVLGCDGARGQSASLIPESRRHVYSHDYPFAWLGVIVETPPVDDFTYIHHSDGFALAAQRGKHLSRYYVQSPLDQDVDAWPDDRFWKTFLHRAPPDVAAQVTTGRTIEKSFARLRSRVIEPMQYGRLYLAGDAAHVVPPTGAKGLNLAISDAALLSRALIAHYAEGRDDLLQNYSADALRKVWAASNFSWRLTRLLHAFPSETPLEARMRQCDYDQLLQSEDLQRDLALGYAGRIRG